MQEGHQLKRKWILKNKDLYPTFFSFNKDLKNYFNVFAVTGMHEALINYGYSDGINDLQGKMVAHKIMQHITMRINNFIIRDSVACGIEYAPNENAGIKLARDDIRFSKQNNLECFVQGDVETGNVWLTSGCSTPTSEGNTLNTIENNAEFQGYATSGSILHHFIEDNIDSYVLCDYLRKIFTKPINYITFTPTLTVCGNCNTRFKSIDGIELEQCKVCNSNDLIVFSRVIGYLKPIARKDLNKNDIYGGTYNFWSKSRRLDWSQRKKTKISDLENLDVEIL
jgi:ribonucleoside-triphosphate reductase